MTNEKNTTIKNKLDIIDAVIKVLLSLTAIFTGVTSFKIKYKEYRYSIVAEQFYGIPRYYFYHEDRIYLIIRFITIILFIVLFLLPIITKLIYKNQKIEKYEAVLYSILSSLFIGLYISTMLSIKYGLNSIFEIILFILITVILMYLIYNIYNILIGFKEFEIKVGENKTCKNICDFIDHFKEKLKKSNIIILIYTLLMVLFSFQLINSTDLVHENPEIIDEYQFIDYVDDDNSSSIDIIVSNLENNKCITIKAVIDKEGNLKIKKGEYRITNIIDKDIKYRTFKDVKSAL